MKPHHNKIEKKRREGARPKNNKAGQNVTEGRRGREGREERKKRSIWYITNEARSKQIGKKDITKKGRKKEREKMTSQNDVKTHSIAQSTQKKHEPNDAQRVSRSTKKQKEAISIPIPIIIIIIITITIKPKEKNQTLTTTHNYISPKEFFNPISSIPRLSSKKIPNQR